MIRCMTPEEFKQGWYEMACGCHGDVWRAAIVAFLPKDTIEFCEKAGVLAVKIEALRGLENDMERARAIKESQR